METMPRRARGIRQEQLEGRMRLLRPAAAEKEQLSTHMITKSRFALNGKSRDSYLELVQAFPLASIKSDRQLEEASKVMDRLLAGGDLDDGEEMYLEALSDLV